MYAFNIQFWRNSNSGRFHKLRAKRTDRSQQTTGAKRAAYLQKSVWAKKKKKHTILSLNSPDLFEQYTHNFKNMAYDMSSATIMYTLHKSS